MLEVDDIVSVDVTALSGVVVFADRVGSLARAASRESRIASSLTLRKVNLSCREYNLALLTCLQRQQAVRVCATCGEDRVSGLLSSLRRLVFILTPLGGRDAPAKSMPGSEV